MLIPSTLQLPPATTAYAYGCLVGNSATAAAIVLPSFTITPPTDIERITLSIGDPAWGAMRLRVDLWTNQPTFNNGDRGVYSIASGGSSYFGSFGVTMFGGPGTILGEGLRGSPIAVDIAPGNFPFDSATTLYWSLSTMTPVGPTTLASQVFSLGVACVQRH